MASAGYPWTVIPVGERNAYLNTLEKASVGQDIVSFADLLAGLVRKRLLASRCHRFRSLPHDVFLVSVARDQVVRKKRI
jgi:hypothetical protein